MVILQIITGSGLGGAQSVVACLANTLCRNHTVIVAAGEGDGKLWNMLDRGVVREPCKTLLRELSPINEFKTILAFHRLWRDYHPDVIHLHSSKAGMLGRLAFPRKRIVYTVHGFDSIRLAYRKFLPIERFMQWRCAAIVAVSNYDRRNLLAEGIRHGVMVVYNGISRSDVEENLEWHIPKSFKRVVLCIARLSPPKNHILFFEVARLLPQYAFVWIGNQREVKDTIPLNVFFLGDIPQASRYCSLADLFMLPSNYEGMPMVILEAMSYGLPIVASNVGGVSEIVDNGVNGYVVDNKAENFAKRIEEILSSENEYESFSRNSKSRFENGLTAATMVEKYERIYNSI